MVRFMNNEGMATTKPTTMVAKDGVWYLGWILEKDLGNKPSRLMLIQILGCPIWKTSNTLAIANTALTAIIPLISFRLI
ncbi:hypothetical protein D3C85_1150980 [compost metagenome]